MKWVIQNGENKHDVEVERRREGFSVTIGDRTHVVDVERLTVEVPAAGIDEAFPMAADVQHRFLNGLDDIGITMGKAHHIEAYEAGRPAHLP